MGGLTSLSLMAYGCGPAVGGFLVDAFGPQGPFVVSGLIAIGCAGLFTKLPETLPNTKTLTEVFNAAWKRKGEKAIAQDPNDTSEETLIEGTKRLVKQKHLQGVFALDSFSGLSWGMYLTIIPVHALNHFEVAVTEYGLALSGAAAAGTVASMAGGWLSDRVGRIPVVKAGTLSACLLTVVEAELH